jgi:hypothetical protein
MVPKEEIVATIQEPTPEATAFSPPPQFLRNPCSFLQTKITYATYHRNFSVPSPVAEVVVQCATVTKRIGVLRD